MPGPATQGNGLSFLLALILIGPFNRFYLEGDSIWQSKAYFSCMDSIAMGCWFALLSHNQELRSRVVTAMTIVGALLLVLVLMVKRDTGFELLANLYLFKTLLSLGVGLLLVAATRQTMKPVFVKMLRPITAYGRLSYEIYLTHIFVVLSGLSLYRKYEVDINDSLIWLIGIVLVSGLLGYVVERYFSAPMNRWLRVRSQRKVSTVSIN